MTKSKITFWTVLGLLIYREKNRQEKGYVKHSSKTILLQTMRVIKPPKYIHFKYEGKQQMGRNGFVQTAHPLLGNCPLSFVFAAMLQHPENRAESVNSS